MKATLVNFIAAAGIALALPATASSASLTYKQGSSTLSYTVSWTSGMTVQEGMQQVGPDYVTGWSHQYSGNSLLMVLATGTLPTTPASTDGKLGSPYWLLCIDGTPANSGMTQQQIPNSNSAITWIWTSHYKCD